MNSKRNLFTPKFMGGLLFAVAGGLLAAPGVRAAVDKPEAACLFTQAELVRVLGKGIGAGEPYKTRAGLRVFGWACRYPGKTGFAKIDVSVDPSSPARFANDRQLAEHMAQPHEFHILTGVGEAAFVGQGGAVEVLSGGRTLRLSHLTLATGRTVSDADIRALLQIGLAGMAKLTLAGH